MRTAVTLAKTHAGEWLLLADPDDNLIEQKKNFRAFRADRSHADYARVVYQEDDGHQEVIRLITPEDKERQEKSFSEPPSAIAEPSKEVSQPASQPPPRHAAPHKPKK